MRFPKSIGLISILCAVLPTISFGQDAHLGVELNKVAQVKESCEMTFLVQNSTQAQVDNLILETVIFDTSGQVFTLTLFDFGATPAQARRVRQFQLAGTQCVELGQILVNGINQCESAESDSACASPIQVTSRTAITVLN